MESSHRCSQSTASYYCKGYRAQENIPWRRRSNQPFGTSASISLNRYSQRLLITEESSRRPIGGEVFILHFNAVLCQEWRPDPDVFRLILDKLYNFQCLIRYPESRIQYLFGIEHELAFLDKIDNPKIFFWKTIEADTDKPVSSTCSSGERPWAGHKLL